MPRAKKSTSAARDANAVDYRYPHEKRTNIPPGRLAGEGIVPKVSKVRYSYSPHLPPTLQFDPTGAPDKLNELVEKATRTPLSAAEAERLRAALQRNEPWLEWSGKREKRWFEVDPVALHMHERVSTQAILRVAAREDVQRDLFADPQQEYSKAVQFYKHEVNWANRMILGDSLQVMASLARRESLAGKVQMIYLDPPYGINFGSNFQPQLGQRDVKNRDQDLTREPETVKAYRDTWTLGTHSYLTYLRDRLVVARELLADSGSIFVQISDENVHRVRLLMDEIFGSNNFVAQINFRTMMPLGSDKIESVYDYIIWFSKSKDQIKYRNLTVPKSVGGDSEFVLADGPNGGADRLTAEEKETIEKTLASRKVFKRSDLYSSGYTPSCTFPFNFEGRLIEPKGKSWRTNKEGIERLIRAERLFRLGEKIYFKLYHSDYTQTSLQNSWADTIAFSGKIYVVETVTTVIERCMLMTTDPGDIVLDPTCGSGTTAYVAEQWGRRWITCDSSRIALALSKHRLMTGKFDYYKLRPLTAEDTARNPHGTWLIDPSEEIPNRVTFQYKALPHITLRSISRNSLLDSIFARHEPILVDKLERLNHELVNVSAAVKERMVQKLIDKHREFGANSITDADTRRWLLPDTASSLIKPMPARKPLKAVTAKQASSYQSDIPNHRWQEWEVPFDTDPEWPQPLQDALIAYRSAWRAKMEEVNACIAANAEVEELVDKPERVKGVLRVSGPFTVEGVRPEELNLSDEGLFDGSPEGGDDYMSPNGAAISGQNLNAYLEQMVQLIRKDGLTFLNNQRRQFVQVDSLFDAATGAVLHAEGSWEDSASPDLLDVAIGFGPQYGPVTALQIEDLIHASKRHNELVVAGFSFDADATALIQEQSHPRLRIHQAYIRPDVNPAMAGLLKETPNSQLFTVFGTPEIEIKPYEDNWIVHLRGVEVYDPVANTISSTGADKVAAWFLDSDFDGRCFCITQAFFPNQDSWEKIAKALGSSANADAFEAFKGTTSIPFQTGKYKRVAVKVIDPRGNEVMAVRALEG